MDNANPSLRPAAASGWERFRAASVRAFHVYATWLVGISWWRFALLSILLLIAAGVLSNLPPFSWTITHEVHSKPPVRVALPTPPKPPEPPARAKKEPLIKIEKNRGEGTGVEISIDEKGVRIQPGVGKAERAASAADAAASAASAAASAAEGSRDIRIVLPPGATSDAVKAAVEEARSEINAAIEEARRDAEEALRDAEEARRDAEQAAMDAAEALGQPHTRIERVSMGEFLPQLALLWIVGSIIIKSTYKSRIQAEVKAAQATEVAESESLKRQVIEARMAAMQAQVEPHFLFNTLASIDHLIETDASRASRMQKNLIALLRASMPTLREANASGTRDLGRELSVIRPYLEILKVRMEDRLAFSIDVPEGLLSAEFPPMMLQSIVENAIKHGLEPKAEGGHLGIKAEILHGKLAITVTDTGLGFGKAATAGTGTGLANIRERLQLLYGNKAQLKITENTPSGTIVSIVVPYILRTEQEDAAA
ncbi:histidine kinase [Rivibacter subsaxonicus]|uniref:histidine kinase n=1 Tax=Rivibacter subsaxonicus TaxID=457575 RepID=A0A4V2FUA0_9BURK|nr:histidine kinase [Rivibacter subsaxonicus]RZU01206.1 histidine kinase [Rivibacter subsaxonicus]